MQCSGLVVSGTAMTIYLGTLRPLLPNSCFQPSLSLHSIVQTCIRSPTWIWGRYLLEKLTPLNLFPVKNQESFFNYVALECCIFYQTEQTLFLSFKLVCKLTNSGFKKKQKTFKHQASVLSTVSKKFEDFGSWKPVSRLDFFQVYSINLHSFFFGGDLEKNSGLQDINFF